MPNVVFSSQDSEFFWGCGSSVWEAIFMVVAVEANDHGHGIQANDNGSKRQSGHCVTYSRVLSNDDLLFCGRGSGGIQF